MQTVQVRINRTRARSINTKSTPSRTYQLGVKNLPLFLFRHIAFPGFALAIRPELLRWCRDHMFWTYQAHHAVYSCRWRLVRTMQTNQNNETGTTVLEGCRVTCSLNVKARVIMHGCSIENMFESSVHRWMKVLILMTNVERRLFGMKHEQWRNTLSTSTLFHLDRAGFKVYSTVPATNSSTRTSFSE